jgi:hypothetical protein
MLFFPIMGRPSFASPTGVILVVLSFSLAWAGWKPTRLKVLLVSVLPLFFLFVFVYLMLQPPVLPGGGGTSPF